MKNRQWLLAGVSAMILTGVTTVSYAQDAPRVDDEIIVTAKARAQNLQDVPLAISVFSDVDLDVRGISDVQDLADATPNLEINSPVGRREAGFSVRGLSASTTDERYQSVGFFVDGVWMGGQVVGLSTADVERIEVIKGPHSTFGRATYGASIDYVTKTPSLEEASGTIKAQLSKNKTGEGANYEITGSVSGPIVPGKVSGSLFGQIRDDAGHAPAVGAPRQDEVGAEKTSLISGVLYTEFSPSTSLKLRGLYSEDDDTMINGYDSGPQYWVQQGANLVQNTAGGPVWIAGAVPDAVREFYYGGDFRDSRAHIGGQAPNTFSREKFFFSGIFDHDFGNGFAFSYKGSYMEQEENANFDGLAAPGREGGIDVTLGDVSILPLGFGGGFENVIREEWEEMSHTVRLLSPDNERMTWSIGGYWYDSRNTNYTPSQFSVDQAAHNNSGLSRIEDIETLAIFGDVEFQLSDQLSISLEGRLQEETVSRLPVPDSNGFRQELATQIDRKESNFDPRITLSYEPNENNNIYALYAEGHKSGRFNLSAPSSFPNGSSNLLPDGTRDPASWVYVDPEGLKNYELGWKSTFLNGRARSNIAIFYQDITDQQFVNGVIVNGQSITQLTNVGETEIFGFEADVSLAVTDNLDIQGAIGYNDQEFKSDVQPPNGSNRGIYQLAGDAAGSETILGRSFTNQSKFSANGSATYSVPVNFMGGDELSIRTDLLYKGKKFVDGANLAYIPDNLRVNLRAALMSENWTLSLFANNLFDDKTAYRGNAFPCGLNAVTDPAVASTLGLAAPAGGFTSTASGQRCLSLLPSPSREVGASIQVSF